MQKFNLKCSIRPMAQRNQPIGLFIWPIF
jgi:hypothetical protein